MVSQVDFENLKFVIDSTFYNIIVWKRKEFNLENNTVNYVITENIH